MDISANQQLPPYEPFKTHQGGVYGEKQTRMYRLVTMKHALKIEALGMRVSRGVNVTSMVKKEFGLKGNKQKIAEQFNALLPDILGGFKPLPGWKEEPYAWVKNKPPDPPRPEHPFGMMQDNPMDKRLSLRELQQKDEDSDVRLLEMLVDAGNNPQVTMQFFNDVKLYGLYEAYLYLAGYAKDGMWQGDLQKVKQQVNKMLKLHGRTRFVENPSDPTYEPDPFRKDDDQLPQEGGMYPAIFFDLFKNARFWRDAEESGDPDYAQQVLSHILANIKVIEKTGMHAPEGYEKKYEKIRNFFLVNPGHGGKRPGAGRPASVQFQGKPYTVVSEEGTSVSFRTMPAAILFCRESSRKTGKAYKIYNMYYGLVAKFDQGGEQIYQKIPVQEGRSQAQPGSGLIRQRPYGHREYQRNPWLVAGPQVNILPEQGGSGPIPQQATPVNIKQEPEEEEEQNVGKIGNSGGETKPQPQTQPSAQPHRPMSEKQHRVRSQIARRQRRSSSGRFYDNPGMGMRQGFFQVYSSAKRGKTMSGYFKFDPVRQIATIRAIEVAGEKIRTFEMDFLADDVDANRLLKALKKNGFTYITKRLMNQAHATRVSEEKVEKGTQPTSGYASAGPPTAGAILLPYKGTSDAVKHAQTLYEQVAHEVAEGDFQQAVAMLLKIRDLVRQGTTENLWALEMASDKAKRLIDNRWPGAIKRLYNN